MWFSGFLSRSQHCLHKPKAEACTNQVRRLPQRPLHGAARFKHMLCSKTTSPQPLTSLHQTVTSSPQTLTSSPQTLTSSPQTLTSPPQTLTMWAFREFWSRTWPVLVWAHPWPIQAPMRQFRWPACVCTSSVRACKIVELVFQCSLLCEMSIPQRFFNSPAATTHHSHTYTCRCTHIVHMDTHTSSTMSLAMLSSIVHWFMDPTNKADSHSCRAFRYVSLPEAGNQHFKETCTLRQMAFIRAS